MARLTVYLTTILLTIVTLISTEGATAEPLTLPFTQQFNEGKVPDDWRVEQADGTKITPNDPFLIFESPADKHAVVARELGIDHVTVTARIHDAATVYLAWDDDTYVGTGKVSPTPFARFHSIERHGGETSEKNHTGCHGSSAHLMRIQLGSDCIRFQVSKGDGARSWMTLRTIERHNEFAGPPTRIMIGKNFDAASDESIVKTDSVGRGNRGLVARIDVEATPTDVLRMTDDERRWLHRARLDPIAELLNSSDRDPTFDEVARYYPEMKYKREIVGVPGQPLDIGTDWLGRIDYSPWEGPIAWFEYGDPAMPFADKPEQIRRRLLDGYVPIVHLSTTRDTMESEMEVFGWSEDFSPTTDLDTYVRLTMWAGGETGALPKKIALTGKEGKRVAWEPQPDSAGLLTLCIRFRHPDPNTAEKISIEQYEKTRAQAASAWRDRLAEFVPFDIPDPRVNEAYRAAIAYSLLNADLINGHLEVHDGAGFYDLVFGHSMSRHATVMDHYGAHGYAAKLLATQIHFQQPNGHYIQECGLPDQGAFVIALATHYLLTKDAGWLQDVKEPLIKACDWIIERRQEAPREGACCGLIKFRPYNDFNDPVFNYWGNILCCQGLEEAAKALRDLGDEEAAERYDVEGAKYRQDILESMTAATIERNGVKMIPIEPDTQRLLKLSKYTGGEYYGLVASDLMDSVFFLLNDPRAALFVNMLENHGGLTAGVCEFQEGMDHAYTGGYLIDRLRHGDVRKTLLGFWSYLAYGSTRDTYSPVEVTLYKSGENHYTLPHTYSCTQLLRLLRCMLLREEGNKLILAQGVPRAWLEPSKRLEVNGAATLFGPVSYRVESRSSSRIDFHLEPPSRGAPQSIEIHLRHPERLGITGVKASSPADIDFDGERITLTNTTKPLDLKVTFEK